MTDFLGYLFAVICLQLTLQAFIVNTNGFYFTIMFKVVPFVLAIVTGMVSATHFFGHLIR